MRARQRATTLCAILYTRPQHAAGQPTPQQTFARLSRWSLAGSRGSFRFGLDSCLQLAATTHSGQTLGVFFSERLNRAGTAQSRAKLSQLGVHLLTEDVNDESPINRALDAY